jgi:hypothetical protein
VSLSGAGFFDSHRQLQGSVITMQIYDGTQKTEEQMNFSPTMMR